MSRGGIALVVLMVVVVALSIGSVRLDSATADEPEHVSTGMIKLTQGRLDFFREQPPLMDTLFAVPILMSGAQLPRTWSMSGNQWTMGRDLLYRSGYDGHQLLFRARLITIAMFAALCAVVFWFVKRQTGSSAWALAAAALTGFCPNVMAHGRLVTVDLPATFFCFTAAVLFLALIESPSIGKGILFGLVCAAAVMTKTSSNILAPWFVIVLIVAYRRLADRRRFAMAMAAGIGAALLFAELFVNVEASAAFLREAHPAMVRAPLLRVALPFAEFADNIRAIETWYSGGHTSPQFFLGDFSYGSWPSYYLIAFLLKTTIPAILVIVIALAMAIRRAESRPLPVIACALFAILMLIAAARGNLALGIRYVLPIYPFLYAGAAIALSREKNLGVVVAILLAWHAAENVANYSGSISYFNELIGSRRNADKFLIDSNLDWGQDLRRLDLWCRDNKVPQITIHYFGGAVVEYDIRSARPAILRAPGLAPLPKGYFALSRHYYRVSFAPRTWGMDYDTYLQASHARYLTTVGGSIYVYRVE
jgi:dolichyl-phosphate-mannose-protein mannosyltransferase